MPEIKCICKTCGRNFISNRSDRTKVCSLSCGTNKKHGMAGTKIYRIHSSMIERCRTKSHHAYESYGARGITVSDDWMSFENFYRDMGDKPKGKSLDRIDNNKGYSKENCRWANIEEQANNRRNTKTLTYKGESLGVSQWSRKLGIPTSTIWNRLLRGLTDQEALVKK